MDARARVRSSSNPSYGNARHHVHLSNNFGLDLPYQPVDTSTSANTVDQWR
jgi:hypothetical protein